MGKVGISFTLFLIVLAGVFAFSMTKEVKGGTGDNVSGYAWSENIGWISFNCTNTNSCGASNYGVNINQTTGNLTGYAWSENIGWIYFAPLGPYPEAPNYSAKLDLATNKFSGWARALSYGGGWDGWIKMAGTATNGSPYEVTRNICNIEGFAWGSEVVGWIKFYNVTTTFCANQAPYVESQVIEYQSYCGIDSGTGLVGFRWTYRDPESDPETRFDFRINNVNNPDDPNPEVDRTINNPPSAVNTQAVSVVISPQVDKIVYNTPYYWWVRVWDDEGANSGWISGPSFRTANHAWPWPDFTHSPQSPSVGQVVNFTDISTCYDAANNSYSCKNNASNIYRWEFGDGTPSSSVRGDTTHAYSSPSPGYTVQLSVTDDLGTCSGRGDSPVRVALPSPRWQEVPPF